MLSDESQPYFRRIKRAFVASAAIHVFFLAGFGMWPEGDRFGVSQVEEKEPLVIDLQPPEQQMARHFVDTASPAREAVDTRTDLISDQSSKASDPFDFEGIRPAPFFEAPSEVDDLGGEPRPEPAEEQPRPPVEEAEPKSEPVAEEPVATEPEPEAVASTEEPKESEPTEQPREEERMQMAKAEPEMPKPPAHMGNLKGRVDGGVKGKGFVGFEAMQHELGPYLKQIRERVENRWRGALEMKYSGTAKTKAVVDCAIAPDGKVAYVNVVEAGDSATYGAICKEAIEGAGPFPPFPFNVPAVYRTKNLEIRWTFNFL